MLTWPHKDADETADYIVDWSALLADDAIVSSTWSVTPAGLGLGASYYVNHTARGDMPDRTWARIWLNAGAEGVTYIVTNTVVTGLGRRLVQKVKLGDQAALTRAQHVARIRKAFTAAY